MSYEICGAPGKPRGESMLCDRCTAVVRRILIRGLKDTTANEIIKEFQDPVKAWRKRALKAD